MKSQAKITFKIETEIHYLFMNETDIVVSAIDKPNEQILLPKHEVDYNLDTNCIIIPEWLAKEKGLM